MQSIFARTTAFRPASVRPGRSSRTTTTRAYAKLKLYSNPATRGQICLWYIKELNKEDEVEIIDLDMKEKREHKSPEFMKINPFGKLPALVDGDMTLYESGAMLLYLADKWGQLPTPAARAKAAQWALFANSTFSQGVFMEALREKQMPVLMQTLDNILATRPYIEGEQFTVCDVAIGAYLLYIPAFLPQADLSPYKNVTAYMQRLAARPACSATVAARAQARKAEGTTPPAMAASAANGSK
eukprot:CAMPEP_0202890572 /NCGR_PEP_ID=MMETSP1392-20130828/931_1 /ASSEMBLY_ACC=CAM_ASM_000868 /TAXON_ID=225041 /ORGANISM="Chlamydomonas chlamydogama, Strain SAG 11-48b" /LENGTH=241 /DNA_ID=CAMNT_0049574169 /DNA_START=66 /DNA_END=791 /DNA_ORIENTATION=+